MLSAKLNSNNFICSSGSLNLYFIIFFSWYHFRSLYQFSTSVIFKFYVFIALLIILKKGEEERGGEGSGKEERERRKNRILMHVLLIYDGYSNVVPIVHHQMLAFTTVTCKAMCY